MLDAYAYGLLAVLSPALVWPAIAALGFALGFVGANLIVWTVFLAAVFWGLGAPLWLWLVVGISRLVLNLPPVRRVLLSAPLMKMLKAMGFLPAISDTERVALEAG